MPNALIYSPSFDGHRQVYVFVIVHILKELGFSIFIAGDIQESFANSYYIDKLVDDKGITIKDTSIYSRGGVDITNEEFIRLQKEYKADLTIFVEADDHLRLFTSQMYNKKKKLLGRTVGIFLRPFYFYNRLSFFNKLRYIRHLPSTWRSNSRLFHEWLLKKFNLVDSALYIDENFVSLHPYAHWLPDVFQSYADLLVKDEDPEQRVWIERLNKFKENNKGKFILFYFGSAQGRRGYDELLKIAVNQDACLIHCGLNSENQEYDINIEEFENVLRKKGRLLKTEQYISDPVCIEYFFKCASHMILPYRNFLGSSGVMLQALSYGIPVLVPENGIMGYRVKKHKLGLTYNDNALSLSEQFNLFKEINSKNFRDSIEKYMKYQSPEQLKKTLVNVFTGVLKHQTNMNS